MKPEIRQQQIMSRLRAVEREWRVDELAKLLAVSPLTIRRDLDQLNASGVMIRTPGGCIAISRSQNAAYQKRVAAGFDLKQAIGRAAAREVKPGNILLINDGSTAFHLASCLGDCGAITVYTNSVAMIGELSRFENVRLILLGGEYNRNLYCLGGGMLERALEALRVDIVFLGADCIDARGRCLASSPDMARDAWRMLRRAKRAVLLADATKYAARAGVVYAALREFDLWITTPGIESKVLRRLRRLTEIREAQV